MIKEAVLYHPLEGGRVKCTACARYCNIPEGKVGFCGVRQNIEGKLQLLVYGKVITGQIDPIEKKPVVHYHPGSKIFSIATTGCSWACDYCQNAEISQRRKAEGVDVEPSGVVEMALSYGCQGLAYTYNQPTIFIEYARDVGILAPKAGLINTSVSNGYDTPETEAENPKLLHGPTAAFKGSAETNCFRRRPNTPSTDRVLQ